MTAQTDNIVGPLLLNAEVFMLHVNNPHSPMVLPRRTAATCSSAVPLVPWSSLLSSPGCTVLCTVLYCAVLRRTVLARTWADTHSHFCLLLWCLVRGHFQLFEL